MAPGNGRTITAAELEEVEAIFHSAVTKRPDEVAAFVETACGRDQLLRDQVATLLASHQRAGGFIETSGAALTLRIVEDERDKELLGQTVGHYRIAERIGAGGMGEVYLATDVTAGRQAALKFLPSCFTGDPERLRRFQQEARAVVGLNHPNIVTVYEVGADGAHHYIASELIAGETLRQRLTRGPMVATEAVDVAIQLGSALAAAHAAGVVHRDVKPENIMLRADGYVKVLDFGIAKLAEPEAPLTMEKHEATTLFHTHLGAIVGTFHYMSPEQTLGRPVDQRTDIWGAGAVLYEMVTGRAPFGGELPPEVVKSILETEPPPLTNHVGESSRELQEIVSRALRKEPADRFQSSHEFAEALKTVRRKMEFAAELERSTPSLMKRLRFPAAAIGLVLITSILILALSFRSFRSGPAAPIAEKSIAVLPFEDFSDNTENSYFAAGIQDDVLTSLAQIRELKVISRTSVMAYQKSRGRNMRQISQALGVANVLEGSVRRTGNRVLVNVQLIDARNDRHIWAERYDRAVADSIGLQGELATQIATALKAELAPEEKARLDVRPTTNSEAYVLYLTGLGLEGIVNRSPERTIAAEQLYMQAAALDPGFALAYARASLLNSGMTVDDRAFEAKARAQAEEALRLSPTLGEAHMALGLCLYWGEKKYDAALKEFEVAAAISPNNAEIYNYVAGIYRRQGRWRESVASFERAFSLDPRNHSIAFHAGNNHLFLRDWNAAAAYFNRALEIAPDFVHPKVGLAYLEVLRNGDPGAGRKILQNIPAGSDRKEMSTEPRWDLAMLERDYSAAEKILTDSPSEDVFYPKTYYLGRSALARGDIESAQRYFAAATPDIEKRVRDAPDIAERHAQLGLLYAYVQRKEDAIRESRRAIELEPESQNAFHGASSACNLALVYALVGESDQAITLIERLLSTPGGATYPDFPYSITLAELRLRWEWDPLRGNARFQKILAGPEPKTVY